MTDYSIVDLLKDKVKQGEIVSTRGWVRTRRDSKAGISFIALNDGSCFSSIQIVAPNTLPNYSDEILHLTAGCSIRVTGKLVASPGKEQAVEIAADKIEIYGWVKDPDTYPIAAKHHTLEYLRDFLHLRARTQVIGAVTRIQNTVAQAVHRYLYDNGFYWIHTPIITASDCEGAGELFHVSTLDLLNIPRTQDGTVDFTKDFFGKETYLAVSGQLHAESYCLALSKVYTFGPTFRAEKSDTNRHLAEFWMIEPEVAFIDLKEDALLAENLIKYTLRSVLENAAEDMSFFEKHIDKDCINRLNKVINTPFKHLDYTEAIELLKKAKTKFEFPVQWGMNLQSEHERYLAEEIVQGPVVVMNYPKDIKAFYMRLNDDNKTVAAMDILFPGLGEIVGGSQREERYDILSKRMDEMHIDKKSYQWYLDLRKYGSAPHAGFGIGFERLVRYITGMQALRDIIPFPRYVQHAEF